MLSEFGTFFFLIHIVQDSKAKKSLALFLVDCSQQMFEKCEIKVKILSIFSAQ